MDRRDFLKDVQGYLQPTPTAATTASKTARMHDHRSRLLGTRANKFKDANRTDPDRVRGGHGRVAQNSMNVER